MTTNIMAIWCFYSFYRTVSKMVLGHFAPSGLLLLLILIYHIWKPNGVSDYISVSCLLSSMFSLSIARVTILFTLFSTGSFHFGLQQSHFIHTILP